MADQQVGNIHGLATPSKSDSPGITNISGTSDPRKGFFDADLAHIDSMRARLSNIDPVLYSETFLNKMTTNDMVYAIRLHDEAYTINDYAGSGSIQALITATI